MLNRRVNELEGGSHSRRGGGSVASRPHQDSNLWNSVADRVGKNEFARGTSEFADLVGANIFARGSTQFADRSGAQDAPRGTKRDFASMQTWVAMHDYLRIQSSKV